MHMMISRLFILYKMKLYLTDWGFWLLSAVKNDKLFLYFFILFVLSMCHINSSNYSLFFFFPVMNAVM